LASGLCLATILSGGCKTPPHLPEGEEPFWVATTEEFYKETDKRYGTLFYDSFKNHLSKSGTASGYHKP